MCVDLDVALPEDVPDQVYERGADAPGLDRDADRAPPVGIQLGDDRRLTAGLLNLEPSADDEAHGFEIRRDIGNRLGAQPHAIDDLLARQGAVPANDVENDPPVVRSACLLSGAAIDHVTRYPALG